MRDGRLAREWIRRQKSHKGASWEAPWWPESYFPKRDLPHAVITYQDSLGKPRSVLATRNVYGDQLPKLIRLLAREKGIRSFILFGNCGSLSPGFPVGTLCFPSRVRLSGGSWRSLDNAWSQNLPKHLQNEFVRTGSVESVYSPLMETVSAIDGLGRDGVELLDVEVGHLPAVIDELEQAGMPIRISTLLLVSDRPGTEHTLSELKETEKRLADRFRLGVDLIVNELDLGAPPATTKMR